MSDLVERLKVRYELPAGYYDDADHGCNVDDPENLIMSILDNNWQGRSIMRGLAANDYSVVPDKTLDEAAARITALEAENERLRKALAEASKAEWFYYGDDHSSDCCRFNIDECIDEDFESEVATDGDHVLQISGARPVPDMWIALHYFTDAEKDERQDDEPYIYTVHATQDEARQALGGPHG